MSSGGLVGHLLNLSFHELQESVCVRWQLSSHEKLLMEVELPFNIGCQRDAVKLYCIWNLEGLSCEFRKAFLACNLAEDLAKRLSWLNVSVVCLLIPWYRPVALPCFNLDLHVRFLGRILNAEVFHLWLVFVGVGVSFGFLGFVFFFFEWSWQGVLQQVLPLWICQDAKTLLTLYFCKMYWTA